MKRNNRCVTAAFLLVGLSLLVSPVETAKTASESTVPVNQVLEWNQIFVDTLIATNTANSSSQLCSANIPSDGKLSPVR